VLLAICDAHYQFRFIDIGAYGRRSDGGVFKESQFGQKLEAGEMNLPAAESIFEGGPSVPYCLVGDEAFPLKPYMLRPYPTGKKKLSTEQHVFNYRLSHARRLIENTFGILANTWRIYRKPIIASVGTAMKMVQATICLHNFLRKYEIDDEYSVSRLLNEETEDVIIQGVFSDITKCGTNTSTREAVRVREYFCDYFNNEGAVPWQWDR